MYQHNVNPKVLYNDYLLRVSYSLSTTSCMLVVKSFKAILVHCGKQAKTGGFRSSNINGTDGIGWLAEWYLTRLNPPPLLSQQRKMNDNTVCVSPDIVSVSCNAFSPEVCATVSSDRINCILNVMLSQVWVNSNLVSKELVIFEESDILVLYYLNKNASWNY